MEEEERTPLGTQGRSHVKTGVEIGVWQLEVKEPQGLLQTPEAGRGRKGSSPEPPGKAFSYRHSDFGLPASRTVKEHISAVPSSQIGGNL